jgi:hypothetical protein
MERTVTPVRTGDGDSNGEGGDGEVCGGPRGAPARQQGAEGDEVRVAGGRTPELVGKEPQGRFWTSFSDLESEDEADMSDGSSGEEVSGLSSPPPTPSARATLGSFITRAAELGGSLRHRRRAAFAPGGKGSLFRGAGRFWRLGDASGRRLGPQRRPEFGTSQGMARRSASAVRECRQPVHGAARGGGGGRWPGLLGGATNGGFPVGPWAG